jgi:hypothetical protein
MLASSWQEQMRVSKYGIAPFERAIQFVENRGRALDIECGRARV